MRAPVLLLACAALLAAGVTAAAWYTIAGVLAALQQAEVSWLLPWAYGLALVLAVASALVLWPLARAGAHSRHLLAALAGGREMPARAHRARAAELAWIVLGYATAQLMIVLLVQFFLINDQVVARTFLNLPLMVETFPLVLDAFWLNVKLFVISGIGCLIWGLIVAIAEIAPGPAGRPLRLLAVAYVDVFRAIPAILVMFLIAFGLPLTNLPVLSELPQTVLIILALVLTVGAYIAEIYRAGIMSIHWSQVAAARSLGLSYMQTLRLVVIPQGIRNIVPPMLNSLIALQKDTALVTVVGAIDSFNQSMIIAGNYYNLSAVTSVAVLFIIVSVPQTRLVERLMERDRRRRARAGG